MLSYRHIKILNIPLMSIESRDLTLAKLSNLHPTTPSPIDTPSQELQTYTRHVAWLHILNGTRIFLF